MSLLTPRAYNTVLRTRTLVPLAATRSLTTSAVRQKTPKEAVTDTMKSVDRAVSDKIVDGIELGETAAEKAKVAAGVARADAKAKEAEIASKAKGFGNEAKWKAAELEGEAKEKAADAKFKVSEFESEAKRKAAEVKAKAKADFERPSSDE